MWPAFQMGKAQCLSFMLVREFSQKSETDKWEQSQQIVGFSYMIIIYLFIYLEGGQGGRGGKPRKSSQESWDKSTHCVLNNTLSVLIETWKEW